jgi:hypothetical protein
MAAESRRGRARQGPPVPRRVPPAAATHLQIQERKVRLGEEIERIRKKREEERKNLWLREIDKGERGRLSVVGFALVSGGVSTRE